MKKGKKDYFSSDVYEKLVEGWEKSGNESIAHKDDSENISVHTSDDKDQEGWRVLMLSVEGQSELVLKWAIKSVAQVTDNFELTAKCLSLFIAYDNQDQAVKAALSFENYNEKSTGLHKVARALSAFKTYAASKPEI